MTEVGFYGGFLKFFDCHGSTASEKTGASAFLEMHVPFRKASQYMLTVGLLLCYATLVAADDQLPAPAAAAAAAPASAFVPSKHCAFTAHIRGNADRYEFSVDGTVDAENTTTRYPDHVETGFQNNEQLVIFNTGKIPVQNPRLTVNGRRPWYSLETMAEEFTRGAKDPQEKIYLLWEGLRQNLAPGAPLFGAEEYQDPVRALNGYPCFPLDAVGAWTALLYRTAGFADAGDVKNPVVRELHGRRVCEVWNDGDYQVMDVARGAFFLDRANRKPASGDAIAHDHELAERELARESSFPPDWMAANLDNAALYGADDTREPAPAAQNLRMGYTLRPGEQYRFRWDNEGKIPGPKRDDPPKDFANGKIIYVVPLGAKPPKFEPAEDRGFKRHWDSIEATEDDACLTIVTESPYVLCGGDTQFAWDRLPQGGELSLALAFGDGPFNEIWKSEPNQAEGHVVVPLDAVMDIHGEQPVRKYAYRLTAKKAAGLSLYELILQADLFVAPQALPALTLGKNHVDYADDTEERHHIKVIQEWNESANVTPPAPPAAPEKPAAGETVKASTVEFSWPAVEGCDLYQLRVSRDPALRYPYRPDFDVLLPENRYQAPQRGLFSPGETYYWHVRARLANGAWSAWSPAWTFQWEGPLPPQNLRVTEDAGHLVLQWDPNPNGAPAARYEVFGSDERGFPVSADAQDRPVLGQMRGNRLQSVTVASVRVAGPEVESENGNKAYYRVVAVDAAGVESAASDYAELPRPWVYSHIATQGRVGRRYISLVRTLTSQGDFQARPTTKGPGLDYYEQEGYRFDLLKHPAWLSIQPDTGHLSGEPTSAGTFPVEVAIRGVYPQEIPSDRAEAAPFTKEGPAFRRETVYRFTITVQPGEGK
jgi:hypothetical protein